MRLNSLATDIAVFGLILAGAFGLGRLALRLMRLRVDRALACFFSISLGLGLLSLVTFLLGVAGLLYRWIVFALLVFCTIAGWLLPRPHWLERQPDEQKWWKQWRSRPGETGFLVLLLLLAIGSSVWVLLVHALMPPHEWDEISYHLALPKIYAEQHCIIYIPFIVHSNWPMNTEMLFTLSLLAGSDVAPHLLMWAMSLFTGTGLYLLSMRYLDHRVGALAATLYLTVPLVKRLAGTGLIDIALGFYVIAAVLAYIQWREQRSCAWLCILGAFCGFAAGSKLMGGAFPLIFGALVLADGLLQRPIQFGVLLKRVALFGAVGLLVAGPWYARSYASTGNPIWPFLYQVFGGKNWDALGDEYHMQSLREIWTAETPLSLKGVLLLGWYIFADPWRLGGYHGGIGKPVLVLAALFSLAFIRAPRLMRELFCVCIAYGLMWFAFLSHQVRFLMPIVPLLALLGAFAFFWLWDRGRQAIIRLIIAALVLYFLIGDFPFLQTGQQALLAQRSIYLLGQISRDEFLSQQIDAMPVFRYANANLPSDAVLFLLPYETRGYYLERKYIWGHPISQRIVRFEEYNTAAGLADTLRQMGITHVLENPHWIFSGLRYWEHDRALMLELERSCASLLLEERGVRLYWLREDGCDDPR